MGNPTLDEVIKSSKVVVHHGRYAYLKAQETVMVGVISSEDLIHLLNDSISWFLLAFLILYFAPTPHGWLYALTLVAPCINVLTH